MSCKCFLAVGYMADKIEIINIIHILVMLQCCKINTTVFKHFSNIRLFLGFLPLGSECINRSVCVDNTFLSVVSNAFRAKQLTICVIDRNDLVNDHHLTTIFGNNRLRSWFWLWFWFWHPVRLVVFWKHIRFRPCLFGWIIRVYLNRSVPIWVGKQSCYVAEVHYSEVCLSFFLTKTSATTDNLLELRHRADLLVKNNQFCHFAINTSWKQLTCSCYDRIFLGNRNEIIQFPLSVFVTTSYTNHIVGIFLAHICIGISQSHTHTFRMSFISTEHYGLSHAICTFQIVGYLLRNFPYTVFYNNVIVIVAVVINAVFYLVAVNILLSLCRSPFVTDVRCDVDNLERSKETVLNSVFKTVSIDWFTKVANTWLIFCFFRCGSHTYMSSRRKVFQDVSPVAIILCATSMTLINDNKVKIVWIRKQFLIVFGIILSNQLLIECKEHLIRAQFFQVVLIFWVVYLVCHLF